MSDQEKGSRTRVIHGWRISAEAARESAGDGIVQTIDARMACKNSQASGKFYW